MGGTCGHIYLLVTMGLRHAFILQVHTYPELFHRIIRRLDAPNHVFIVHVDKKADKNPFFIPPQLPKGGRIIFVPDHDRRRIYHSGFSQVKCTLKLLGTSVGTGADYIHFISGQDYPCVAMNDFDDFFETSVPLSYMEYDSDEQAAERESGDYPTRYRFFCFTDFPYRHKLIPSYIMRGLDKIAAKIKIRKEIPGFAAGCNWFTWHSSLAIYVLDYLRANKRYCKRYRYTRCSDEFFFHTLLNGKDKELNIERHNALRYIDWHPKRSYEGNLPLILDERDYDNIINSGALFCRKVHPVKSAKLMDMIDASIANA